MRIIPQLEDACKNGRIVGKTCSKLICCKRKKKTYRKDIKESTQTCNSGSASDSKDATSTLYLPTLGHPGDSGLQIQSHQIKPLNHIGRVVL